MTDHPDIDSTEDREGRELVGRLFLKPQPSSDPAVIFGQRPNNTDNTDNTDNEETS